MCAGGGAWVGVGGEGRWPRITFFFHKADLMQKDLGCQERFPLLSPSHTHQATYNIYPCQPRSSWKCRLWVLILEARLYFYPSPHQTVLDIKKPFSRPHVRKAPSVTAPHTHIHWNPGQISVVVEIYIYPLASGQGTSQNFAVSVSQTYITLEAKVGSNKRKIIETAKNSV